MAGMARLVLAAALVASLTSAQTPTVPPTPIVSPDDHMVSVPPPGKPSEQPKKSYKGAQVLVLPREAEEGLREIIDEKDIELWGKNNSHFDFYVPENRVNEFKSLLTDRNITFGVTIEDVQDAIETENPSLTEEEMEELSGKNGHRMTFQAYHKYQDIHGYLDYLAQTYPKLVTVGTLGSSVEGRPLKYIKISSGESNAKAFWIDGGIHAREWISPAVTTYIIKELVENRDAHAAEIGGIDFYILPILNPDGYEYTHRFDRLWRKNRRKSGFSCPGVDLNRNWGYKWGGKGGSKYQCKEVYIGSSPFSEPETASTSRFILSIPRTNGFVTFHSYGQYILYPFGHDTNAPAPNTDELDRVGRKAAQAMQAATGTHYTVGNSAKTLYPASGGSDDWAKGVAKIKYTYTIELRDHGRFGFLLPAHFILPTAKEGLAAIKAISSEIKNAP